MNAPFIVLHLVKCEAFVEGQERHITIMRNPLLLIKLFLLKQKALFRF